MLSSALTSFHNPPLARLFPFLYSPDCVSTPLSLCRLSSISGQPFSGVLWVKLPVPAAPHPLTPANLLPHLGTMPEEAGAGVMSAHPRPPHATLILYKWRYSWFQIFKQLLPFCSSLNSILSSFFSFSDYICLHTHSHPCPACAFIAPCGVLFTPLTACPDGTGPWPSACLKPRQVGGRL